MVEMVSLVLTEKASSKVKEPIRKEGMTTDNAILRITLKTAEEEENYRYGMALDTTSDKENDLQFEQEVLRLTVDKESADYLDGAEIDYIEQEGESGFTVRNPRL